MKKVLIMLLVTLCSSVVMMGQTTSITKIKIKKSANKALSNHIVTGFGIATYEDKHSESLTSPFFMLGYYRTDLFDEKTVGLYVNLTAGDVVSNGIVLGGTYKYYTEDLLTVYLIGGLGVGTYSNYSKNSYRNRETSFRIEGGSLLSYKRFDVRGTLGYPDYFSLGLGFNF